MFHMAEQGSGGAHHTCRSCWPGKPRALFPLLLVGTKMSDDAAVWQMSDDPCVIATTDFFMLIVDDPRHCGRVAATNAIRLY